MKNQIKLVCFDLNKTLIHENSWLELNLAMGITQEEDERLFEEYNNNKLSYIDWQKKLEKIYIEGGKANKDTIINVLSRYTYKEGAKDVVRYLIAEGYHVTLLSGSMNLLVDRVAEELGISSFYVNNYFIFNSQGYLETIKCLGDDVQTKADQFRTECSRLGVDFTEAACVGDGDNDIDLFRLSDHGITFKGSKIENRAWRVINELKDLKEIL